jgi:hypothetical protein
MTPAGDAVSEMPSQHPDHKLCQLIKDTTQTRCVCRQAEERTERNTQARAPRAWCARQPRPRSTAASWPPRYTSPRTGSRRSRTPRARPRQSRAAAAPPSRDPPPARRAVGRFAVRAGQARAALQPGSAGVRGRACARVRNCIAMSDITSAACCWRPAGPRLRLQTRQLRPP